MGSKQSGGATAGVGKYLDGRITAWPRLYRAATGSCIEDERSMAGWHMLEAEPVLICAGN